MPKRIPLPDREVVFVDLPPGPHRAAKTWLDLAERASASEFILGVVLESKGAANSARTSLQRFEQNPGIVSQRLGREVFVWRRTLGVTLRDTLSQSCQPPKA